MISRLHLCQLAAYLTFVERWWAVLLVMPQSIFIQSLSFKQGKQKLIIEN